MRFAAFAFACFVACGAIAGALVAELVPTGARTAELHRQQFRLVRGTGEELAITPPRWFFLPYLFGDFDLRFDLELAEGTTLDLLLRQVEPRLVGPELLPFSSRYAVLRLASDGDGIGFRSRDEAVLGGIEGGIELVPGLRATVWIEARGDLLRANVAGTRLPWFRADDRYGMFAMIARRGHAVLHEFVLDPRPTPTWPWARATWAAIGAVGSAVLAAILLALGERWRWLLLAGPALVLLAALTRGLGDLDLAFPSPSWLLVVASGHWLCVAAGSRVVRWPFALAAAAVGLWLFVAADRGLRHDDATIAAVFGPDAGDQISRLHAQLVPGPQGLHDVGGPRPRVFLLGGEQVYGGAPGQHLAGLLARELRAALRRPVDVPSLPTVDGHPAQQWQLFTTCCAAYEPEVLVFGLGPLEGDGGPNGGPRTTPAQLHATLAAVRAHAAEHGAVLVGFATAGVEPALLDALREAARDGVPLVVAEPGEPAAATARRLAEAVLPALRR